MNQKIINTYMRMIDDIVYDDKWRPLWGWHDDYEGGDAYLPAIQQDRREFRLLLEAIYENGLRGDDKCLQLGMGTINASHEIWRKIFSHVTTIDLRITMKNENVLGGMDTHDFNTIGVASRSYPYDFLFIDAGHLYDDVRQDYENYSPLVRQGGIIAFHDALPREKFPGIEVHRFLSGLQNLHTVGREVGTAWMVKQ